MYNNWNHHKYLYVKNFIPIEDLNVILKDIEYYFTSNLHKEEKGSVIKSGQQTKPNLHIIGKSKRLHALCTLPLYVLGNVYPEVASRILSPFVQFFHGNSGYPCKPFFLFLSFKINPVPLECP